MKPAVALVSRICIGLGLSAGGARAADGFQMLPSDTDPSIIEAFRMLETDVVAPGSQQTVFDGNESAGAASLETGPNDAVIFRDSATASSASIVNNGGQTRFEDQSTAASSSLTANEGGYVRFSGTSTAADSRIVINEGGRTDFDEDATAGDAVITDNSYLRFAGRSTAGNAQITVNESGVLAFRETSQAGIAQITNNGLTGFFDTSTLAGGSVTNNEGATIVFADDSSAGTTSFIGNSGTVVFADRSTLGEGAVTNNETGILRFEDDSSAGDGFISSSGAVIFTDRSSAADAEIVGNEGGLILFRDDSSAGRANISGGADLRFAGRSSAAQATVTMAPGTTLSFTQSASGGTASVQLDAGSTLDISAADNPIDLGTLTGAGDVALGANTLGVGNDTPLTTFAGTIDDDGRGGGFVKRGSGTLNLSGQSTYSGATTVEAGTLEAGAENVFAKDSAFTVEEGATLALAGFDQEIGSLDGAGNVDASAGSVLTTGGNDRSTVFSGAISGSGGINKIGTGELALTGVSSYTGDTNVRSGVLRVDGDISPSSVTVDGGATISGGGVVGSSSVAGTLQGGADGEGLTVAGDLTLESGATTVVAVSGGQASKFTVTGQANLAGALSVQSSGAIDPGVQYVFLTAGLVVGTYDEIVSDLAFLNASVSYSTTSAALDFERNDVSFDDVARTTNQRATAVAVEAQGQGNALFDAVLPLSESGAQAAFDNLSGEGHATMLAALGDAQAEIGRTVLDQIGRRTASGLWAVAQTGRFNRPGDGNGADATSDVTSLISGADFSVNNELALGAYGYLGHLDLSSPDRATRGEMRSAGVGVYTDWKRDRLQVRAAGDFSYNALELERQIAVGAVTGTARSAYPAWSASAFAELSYDVEAGDFSIEPYVGLAYVHSWTGGFEEDGAGAADLSSDGSDNARLDGAIGVRTSHTYTLETGLTVTPTLGLGYIRNLAGGVTASNHRFAGGEDFSVFAARTVRDSAAIDARVALGFSDGMQAGLFYRGLLSDEEYSQLIGANLSFTF